MATSLALEFFFLPEAKRRAETENRQLMIIADFGRIQKVMKLEPGELCEKCWWVHYLENRKYMRVTLVHEETDKVFVLGDVLEPPEPPSTSTPVRTPVTTPVRTPV